MDEEQHDERELEVKKNNLKVAWVKNKAKAQPETRGWWVLIHIQIEIQMQQEVEEEINQ